MIVRSGISWEQKDGTWRRIDVTVSHEDLALDQEGTSARAMFKECMNNADRFIIAQLAREGVISTADAKTQLAALDGS